MVGGLTGIRRWGHGHLLLEPSGDKDQHWHDHVGRVWFRKVHPQEAGSERGGGVDRKHGDPCVEFLSQRHQIVGARVQRLYQHPEQPEKDGHLDYQRAKAAYRADTGLPVHTHRFLGDPLPVTPVTILDFAHPGLEVHHRSHLAQLLDGQRQRHQPDNDREHNDGDAHVVEADGVQHHQQVQHGTYDDFSPEVAYKLQITCLTTRALRPVDRSARRLPTVFPLVAPVVIVFRVPAPPLFQRTARGGIHPADTAILRPDKDRFTCSIQRRCYF